MRCEGISGCSPPCSSMGQEKMNGKPRFNYRVVFAVCAVSMGVFLLMQRAIQYGMIALSLRSIVVHVAATAVCYLSGVWVFSKLEEWGYLAIETPLTKRDILSHPKR